MWASAALSKCLQRFHRRRYDCVPSSAGHLPISPTHQNIGAPYDGGRLRRTPPRRAQVFVEEVLLDWLIGGLEEKSTCRDHVITAWRTCARRTYLRDDVRCQGCWGRGEACRQAKLRDRRWQRRRGASGGRGQGARRRATEATGHRRAASALECATHAERHLKLYG